MEIKPVDYIFPVTRQVIQLTPEMFDEDGWEFEFWMEDLGFKARRLVKGGGFSSHGPAPEFIGAYFYPLYTEFDETPKEARYGDYLILDGGSIEVMTKEQFEAAGAVPATK